MPNFEDTEFLDGDSGDSDDGDGADDSPSTPAKDPKSTDKRISDLQSMKDKETARANKAEARLQALLEAAKDKDAESGKPVTPVAGDASAAILDMARMFAVQQHPKLAEYGLSESDLTGSTPSEIARSAGELIARFEKIETQVRNKVLADNGLAPEVDAGVAAAPNRDFSKMSSEDFKKIMDAAMQGRVI